MSNKINNQIEAACEQYLRGKARSAYVVQPDSLIAFVQRLHSEVMPAALLRGIKLGLEAAAKKCGKRKQVNITLRLHGCAAESRACAEEIRAIDPEQVAKEAEK